MSTTGVNTTSDDSTSNLTSSPSGSIADVSPTYVNPANANSYYQQYSNMLASSMQPYNQQQSQALEGQLASSGIQNSGAAGYLQGNLAAQQQANLTSADTQFLNTAFGYNQQADLANAGYANAASDLNASSYNTYQNELLGYGANEQNELLSAYLGTYEPNSEVGSLYGEGLSGELGGYGNIYSSALQGEGSALGGAASGLGTFFGDAAEAGLL